MTREEYESALETMDRFNDAVQRALHTMTANKYDGFALDFDKERIYARSFKWAGEDKIYDSTDYIDFKVDEILDAI